MLSSDADDIIDQAREAKISQVRVIFLDYNGLARARSVSLAHLSGAFHRGVNFSSPTVDFNSRDLFPPAAGFDLASPDFWARADPATFQTVPHPPGVGQMYADLVDAAGEPWAGCPRTALRRLIDRGREKGLEFNVGFEPEGYIFREEVAGDSSPARFAGIPEFASLAGLDVEPAFMRDLLDSLAIVGLEVEQWSEEYGPGQIEINLRYGPPLAAADRLVTFKEVFRATARRHGLLGSFMPKPFGDQAGSGLHVHLSAWSAGESPANLFDQPHDPLGLSPLGRHALAGLLAHGEALTALGATTVNSYKRFLPDSWAPTHIVAAYASRAAFVRIPERETSRRLELRVGDPAGNPYLYLAGILAAVLDGVERKLAPEPIVPGNVGALSADETAGIRPVPHTLAQALDQLEKDSVMREALGSLIVDEFVKIKRSEWEAFITHVGEWDRIWYLGRY